MWWASPARVLAAASLVALAAAARLDAQQFKSRVDLVALAVTVTDHDGRAVTGLGADHFRVFDNGVPQQIALFGTTQVPLDVVLVLDTSSSMTNALAAVKSGAQGLLATLRPGDRAAVVEVKRTLAVEPLTEDLASVGAAIGDLSVGGETALYNGVYLSLRQFERDRGARPQLRRQALVLFSDGVDTASQMGFDEVSALARALDVTIYSIALDEGTSSKDAAVAEASSRMRALTRDTGGMAYFPRHIRELKRVYETIASELVNQYALAYVAPVPGQGQTFRRVSIGLVPPAQGLARTRAGYTVAAARGRTTLRR